MSTLTNKNDAFRNSDWFFTHWHGKKITFELASSLIKITDITGYSLSNKAVVLLIGKVEETLKGYDAQCDLGSSKELALDRLGQFLHCLTATGGIQGKLSEIFNSVKRIQDSNRLLQMYINRG